MSCSQQNIIQNDCGHTAFMSATSLYSFHSLEAWSLVFFHSSMLFKYDYFCVVWNHSKSWQTMLHFLKQQVFCVILCHWRVMLVCRHLSESPVIWRFQWSLNVFLVILCLASQHWMKQLCRNGSGCFLQRSGCNPLGHSLNENACVGLSVRGT